MACEENATGCHLSSFSMDRTAPVAKSEASVSSLNWQSLLGYARIGVVVKHCLSCVKALASASPHVNVLSFWVRSISCYNRGAPYFIFSILSCRQYTSLSFLLQWLHHCSIPGLSQRSRHLDLDLRYAFLSWQTIPFHHVSLYSMVISILPLLANNRHLPSLSSLLSSHLGRHLLDSYINPPMYRSPLS